MSSIWNLDDYLLLKMPFTVCRYPGPVRFVWKGECLDTSRKLHTGLRPCIYECEIVLLVIAFWKSVHTACSIVVLVAPQDHMHIDEIPVHLSLVVGVDLHLLKLDQQLVLLCAVESSRKFLPLLGKQCLLDLLGIWNTITVDIQSLYAVEYHLFYPFRPLCSL